MVTSPLISELVIGHRRVIAFLLVFAYAAFRCTRSVGIGARRLSCRKFGPFSLTRWTRSANDGISVFVRALNLRRFREEIYDD
jgi:hypothetical protein